jgi:hypothetical protein
MQVHRGITIQVTHQVLRALCQGSQPFLLWEREKEQFQFRSNLIDQRTLNKRTHQFNVVVTTLRGNRRFNPHSQRQSWLIRDRLHHPALLKVVK